MTTLGARGASTADTWRAAHFLCASGIYRELLESLIRNGSWTRNPVIVTSVLDGAAEHLEKGGIARLDNAKDILMITERDA